MEKKYLSSCPYQIFIIDDDTLEIKDFNRNSDIYPISMGILEIVKDFTKKYENKSK